MSELTVLKPEIRRAALDDIPAMLGIEQQAQRFPWSEKNFFDSFGRRAENFVLCAPGQDEGTETVLGFYLASHVAGEGELLNIAVSPQCQGQGYGRQLLEHLLAQAAGLELEQLWLEVRRSNQPAIGLYQQLGFHEAGVRKGYYPAVQGREDALIMGLTLA